MSLTPEDLSSAYRVGCAIAQEDMEKHAFLGQAFSGAKFLLGMGNLGQKGSGLARLSAHHVGMPLGFGAFAAMGAEEGEKSQAFVKGLAGGLAFNLGMPLGASIGKRLLAPGFRGGVGNMRIMKGLGFGDDAVKMMGASHSMNKPMHGAIRALERRLGAGTASKADLSNMFGRVISAGKAAGKNMSPEMAETYKKILAMRKKFMSGALDPKSQSELSSLYSQFSKQLYKQGKGMGPASAQRGLAGIRAAKMVGGIGGGMALGFQADHAVQDAFSTTPASVFDATGGH